MLILLTLTASTDACRSLSVLGKVDIDASGRGCSMRVAQYGVDGGGIGVEVMDSVNNALTNLSKIGGVFVVSQPHRKW